MRKYKNDYNIIKKHYIFQKLIKYPKNNSICKFKYSNIIFKFIAEIALPPYHNCAQT